MSTGKRSALRYELAGLPEMAELFGVSRAAVDTWTRQRGFPDPALCLGMGTAWDVADLIAWAKTTKRDWDLARYRECMRVTEAATRARLKL